MEKSLWLKNFFKNLFSSRQDDAAWKWGLEQFFPEENVVNREASVFSLKCPYVCDSSTLPGSRAGHGETWPCGNAPDFAKVANTPSD